MEETPEIQFLTPEQIKGFKATPLNPDLLRQQAGINPVDKQRKPIGTTIKKPPEDTVKKIPDDQRTLEQTLTLQKHFWLNPDETPNYPQLVLEKEQETTIGGLIDLGKKIHEVVNQWLNQGEKEKRHSLSEVLQSSTFSYEVILSLEKIEKLLALKDEGLNPALCSSLEALRDFYQADVLPLLGITINDQGEITDEKGKKLQQQARQQLETKKGKKGQEETYQQKARRILIEGKTTIQPETGSEKKEEESKETEEQKKQRANSLYHNLIRLETEKELPKILNDELLRIAQTINYVRLLEVVDKRLQEKKHISLPQLKEEVQKLLSNIPTHNEGSDTFSEEEKQWFKNLNTLLAPVANIITQEFPHDTVYLLSQALEHKQAVCAGKTMMLTMLYRSLGLDARVADVLLIYGSKYQGEHQFCQINLPNNIILNVDSNWYPESYSIDLGIEEYQIFAGLLIPTGETFSDEQLKQFLDDPEKKDISVVLKSGQRLVYKVIGNAHRLTSQASENYIFDKNSLAFLLCENAEVFAYENSPYGETKNDVYRYAASLYEEILKDNPNDALAKDNLASLLWEHAEVFAYENSPYGETKNDVYRYAVSLYEQILKDNPNYGLVMYNKAVLIMNHYNAFGTTPEEKIKKLEEAIILFEGYNKLEEDEYWKQEANNNIKKINEIINYLKK